MQTFGQHLKHLLQVQSTLPANSQLRAFIDQIADTVGAVLNSIQPIPQNEAYSGATPNKDFILQANVAYLDAAMKVAITNAAKYGLDPQKLQELINYVASLDTRIQLQQQPEVQKATTAAIKGIQLNTRGEFVVKDKEIKEIADNFAKRFGLKPIWARNLIGMFDISVSHEDRVKFLVACNKGEALDIDAMIRKGQGKIQDCVTTKIPKLKQVFESIKETLLDISLSTGQRGATGPFEALVAIMGGGRKPTTQEGGDIVLKYKGKDLKLELKAGSISVNSKNGSPGYSGAWLDSTEGGEQSPAKLRNIANEWVEKNIKMTPDLKAIWDKADFRPGPSIQRGPLAHLKLFLEQMAKKNPNAPTQFIGFLMASVFPSIANTDGYNFKLGVKNIVKGIYNVDSKAVAKEQAIMALLEYITGKGNDGFLLFNSSTQEYKIIMGAKGVIDLYHSKVNGPEESLVRFEDPMTMLAKSTKCTPSIYFGPAPSSSRGKEYAAKYMSDPQRVALRAKAEAAGDPEFQDTTADEVPAPRARRPIPQTPQRQRR